MARWTSLVAVIAPATLVLAAPLAAQRWQPDEACDLPRDHFLLRSASLYLKQAHETPFPNERDRFLGEADRVLQDALENSELTADPSLWYFLGRLYFERHDVIGADTAFQRVEDRETTCANEIVTMRKGLARHALSGGMRAWQAEQADSAITLLRLVRRMDPVDAGGLTELARIWVDQEQIDSAEAALRDAYEIETTDTTAIRRRRDVHFRVLRTYRARVSAEAAVARWRAASRNLDRYEATIARDSTGFANMLGRVAEIRARGQRLNEGSLRAFQAESTSIANRMASTRRERDSLVTAIASDRQAVDAVVEPAIAKYTEFLAVYPEHVEAAAQLAALYAVRGETDEVNRVVGSVVERAEDLGERDLFRAGTTLLDARQPRAAARVLNAGLELNPFDLTGLVYLCRAHVANGHLDSALAVAKQIADVDPLSQRTQQVLAFVWEARGVADSVQKYRMLANERLQRLVTVTQFEAKPEGARVTFTVRNRGTTPLAATTLLFDFLSAEAEVVTQETVQVPPLDPNAFKTFTVEASGSAILAWRYRVQ